MHSLLNHCQHGNTYNIVALIPVTSAKPGTLPVSTKYPISTLAPNPKSAPPPFGAFEFLLLLELASGLKEANGDEKATDQ